MGAEIIKYEELSLNLEYSQSKFALFDFEASIFWNIGLLA